MNMPTKSTQMQASVIPLGAIGRIPSEFCSAVAGAAGFQPTLLVWCTSSGIGFFTAHPHCTEFLVLCFFSLMASTGTMILGFTYASTGSLSNTVVVNDGRDRSPLAIIVVVLAMLAIYYLCVYVFFNGGQSAREFWSSTGNLIDEFIRIFNTPTKIPEAW